MREEIKLKRKIEFNCRYKITTIEAENEWRRNSRKYKKNRERQ